jgi:hypothetical protein
MPHNIPPVRSLKDLLITEITQIIEIMVIWLGGALPE